jgi:hypothetical protein
MRFADERATGEWTTDPRTQVEWPVPAGVSRDRVAEHARRADAGELRMIRFSPDWGVTWPLWESACDKYAMEPSDYGLSRGLIRALRAWMSTWERNCSHTTGWVSEAIMAEWNRGGAYLANALQLELYDVARISSDFEPEG